MGSYLIICSITPQEEGELRKDEIILNKFRAFEDWFEQQTPSQYCAEDAMYYIDRFTLQELQDDCKRVMENPSLGEELFPITREDYNNERYQEEAEDVYELLKELFEKYPEKTTDTHFEFGILF